MARFGRTASAVSVVVSVIADLLVALGRDDLVPPAHTN